MSASSLTTTARHLRATAEKQILFIIGNFESQRWLDKYWQTIFLNEPARIFNLLEDVFNILLYVLSQ